VKGVFQDIMSIQQPYSFILRDDQYFFETENKIKYRVEIKDGSAYFIDFKPYLSVSSLTKLFLRIIFTFALKLNHYG
jgi:hypothetical protein